MLMEKLPLKKIMKLCRAAYTEKPSHEGEGAKLDINFSNRPLSELNKN